MTREELWAHYGSETFQESLLEHLSLVSILRSSIIGRKYVIPDDINESLAFTDHGIRVRDEMIKKESVPAKEARLLTYLALVHVEPLIDFEKINMERLRTAISAEIEKRDLIFPFIFGNDLYNRAAQLFPDEREYLKHDDTLRLLEGTPQGVFHAGNNLIGPLGIIRTSFERSIQPRTLVPLQHCPDPSCFRIHRVQLATSIEAGVNRHRPALNKALDAISRDPSEWNGYLSDILRERDDPFDDTGEALIPYLLGDCLDDSEILALTRRAIDTTSGRTRSIAASFGFSGSARTMTESMDRSRALQLLLTEDDASLVRLVDDAVDAGTLRMPKDEVRRLRVNRAVTASAWRLRPELSHLGFRSVTDGQAHAIARLSLLVEGLYDLDQTSDRDSLAWILRDFPAETLERNLEQLLRTLDPPEIVRRVVLDRKQNLERVAQRLGFSPGGSDDETVERIVWKLGFKVVPNLNTRTEYWASHTAFERAAKDFGAALVPSHTDLRSAAANYAVALEHYLLDCVIFASWALLNDHYSDLRPFVYRESRARELCFDELESAAVADARSGFALRDRPALSSLIESFGVLARLLQSHQKEPSARLRSPDSLPRFASRTRMQLFPLGHTIPFLDLTPESQSDIIANLIETTSALSSSRIAESRNKLLHANREPLQPSTVVDALAAVSRVISRLEYAGLAPRVFALAESGGDRWGRGWTVLVDGDGERIQFPSPSRLEWLGLPSFLHPQFVMRAATVGGVNGLLRFRPGFDSTYEAYWSEFPRRRERGNALGGDRSDSLATPIETGAHVSSRAD